MAKWTPAGEMRTPLHVYRYFDTGTDSDRGQPERERRRVFHVMAAVGPLRGLPSEVARKMVTNATVQINTRWNPSLGLQDELQWKDSQGRVRIYAISSIENIQEQNREHEILCTETQL